MLLCLEYEVFFGMFFAFWISARKGPFMFQNIISSTKVARKTVPDDCGFSEKDVQLRVFGKGDNKDHFNDKMQVSLGM